ncbi:P-loop containing nucleoside triphosphate hydrolase protein [Chlamydoabsidia padenii]|nr:P-loop containing nucleoside triphosphate hydrolase protein [Chlamydoabsidia padenii]
MAKKKKNTNNRGYAITSFPSKKNNITAQAEAMEILPPVQELPTPLTPLTPSSPDEVSLLTHLVRHFEALHSRKAQIAYDQLTQPIPTTDRLLAVTALPTDIEQAIILTTPLPHHDTNFVEGRNRVVAHWHVIYLVLQQLGFDSSDIRSSFQNTLSTRLESHLDYLCLFVPYERMPVGFYDAYFAKESLKISLTAATRAKMFQEEEKQGQVQEQLVILSKKEDTNHDLNAHKERVLQAAQTYLYDDEDDDKDIHQTHAETKLALLDLESKLGDQKKKKKKKKKEESNTPLLSAEELEQIKKKIKHIKETLQTLEQDWDFDHDKANACLINEQRSRAELRQQRQQEEDNKQLKKEEDEEDPKEEEQIQNQQDDNDDLEDMFGFMDIMEQQDEPPPPPKQWNVIDLTVSPHWNGRTPKQLLEEYGRKHQHSSYQYNRISQGNRLWQASVILSPQHIIHLPADMAANTSQEAENLVAAMALFELDPHASIYQVMAPPFRDLWLSWKKTKMEQEEATRTAEERDRIQFLLDTYDTIDSFSKTGKTNPKTPSPLKQNTTRGLIFRKHHMFASVQQRFATRLATSTYLHMKEQRHTLPIANYRQEIISLVSTHQVIIVSGETGCGKSTQVPQFLAEHVLVPGSPYGHVICTQPRRISATSIAQRVSNEMGDSTSIGSKEAMVGYQIRTENKSSDETVLMFCTTGILLRRLERDQTLKDVTHVVVDEVHERSLDSDFLLILLKKLCALRPDLRVILMSATVNADRFSAYFDHCPVLTVPGRTFPVHVQYLEDIIKTTGYLLEEGSYYAVRKERIPTNQGNLTVSGQHGSSKQIHYELFDSDSDTETSTLKMVRRIDENKINYDLIIHLLEYIFVVDDASVPSSGAILIFLPGMGEIRRLYDLIAGHFILGDPARSVVYALHSALTEQVTGAFQVPPQGIRKLVLATNIAETGITISDVTIVIDTGMAKIVSYDQKKKITRLRQMYVAKANVHQRKGRAGRIQEGVCYHLFTRTKYDSLANYETPEILRLPLEELCLRIKACQMEGTIEQILSSALDAPSPTLIQTAIDNLVQIQAFTPIEHTLTPLGAHLANLPVNVHIGKMILYGALFRCLDPILTIAAAISFKSPFIRPFGSEIEADHARHQFRQGDSDFLTLYQAYKFWRDETQRIPRNGQWRKKMHKFCQRHFLSHSHLETIEDMKKQYLDLLSSIGFVVSDNSRLKKKTFLCDIPTIYNQHAQSIPMINAAITAGMYPKLAMKTNLGTYCKPNMPLIHLHPSSVSQSTNQPFLIYNTMVMMNNDSVSLWETTPIDPVTILLLANDMVIHHSQKLVMVDQWIQLHCVARTAVLIQCLRQAIKQWMKDKMVDPTLDLTTTTESVMTIMVRTLELANKSPKDI